MKGLFNAKKEITMKKICILVMLVLAGVMAEAQTSVWTGSRRMWNRGSGTEDDPFLIESAEHLAYLSFIVGKGIETRGKYFKLTTDIDLNGRDDFQWFPIGVLNDAFYEDGCERGVPINYQVSGSSFGGHFDGGDHRISNLYVDNGKTCAGLFGIVEGTEEFPAVVEHVFVTNGYVKGSFSGGVVGGYSSGKSFVVSHCWNGADIEGADAGGIVGGCADRVYNCYNLGNVTSTGNGGGIVGRSANEISECYNEGNVSTVTFAGGILGGYNTNIDVVVSNCYNTGSISSAGQVYPSIPGSFVGGIVGFIMKGVPEILNCYNVGTVSSAFLPPCGVAGFIKDGYVDNCYYLNTCGGSGEGYPMAAETMRDPSFVDMLNYETNVWCADTLNHNDGYPILGNNNLAVDEYDTGMFALYPNPSRGKITVEGTGTMRVFNVLGQAILTSEIKEQAVFELPQGLYFIRLETGDKVGTRRVVVE